MNQVERRNAIKEILFSDRNAQIQNLADRFGVSVRTIQLKKLKEGSDLVRFFSIPCKPTKANGYRTRNLPEHAPERWARFKQYCIRDVDAEREIRHKLRRFPIPAQEQLFYQMDQEINDR